MSNHSKQLHVRVTLHLNSSIFGIIGWANVTGYTGIPIDPEFTNYKDKSSGPQKPIRRVSTFLREVCCGEGTKKMRRKQHWLWSNHMLFEGKRCRQPGM